MATVVLVGVQVVPAVPVVLVAVLGLTGPWMLRHLLDYTRSLFEMIPLLVG